MTSNSIIWDSLRKESWEIQGPDIEVREDTDGLELLTNGHGIAYQIASKIHRMDPNCTYYLAGEIVFPRKGSLRIGVLTIDKAQFLLIKELNGEGSVKFDFHFRYQNKASEAYVLFNNNHRPKQRFKIMRLELTKMETAAQESIDSLNMSFWEDLCGSWLAQKHGIFDLSTESLKKYDYHYMALYPYLYKYLAGMKGKKVLEIGLGYGTVGQMIAAEGAIYHGIDIAKNPVRLMNYRMKENRLDGKASVGSALGLPFPDETFDVVVSIGCLHHTGNIKKAIDEVHRILKKDGKAVIMVYNKFAYQQWLDRPLKRFSELLGLGKDRENDPSLNAVYDVTISGESAPYTEFFTKSDLKAIFSAFKEVSCCTENTRDMFFHGKTILKRERTLNNLGHWLGLDWYITATK